MEPLVSICCITYNHEKYISDAIESFLMQKTNFPIEIIIHDDASTDKTANIIKGYKLKYPDIIKPIYQTENQYSKGIKILDKIIVPRAKGKYIATCEGDDFWIDSKKLQKQFEFLETNSNYSMCFHAVSVIDTNKKKQGKYLGLYGSGTRDCAVKETAKGGIVHISSLFTRTDYFRGNKPKWMNHAIHGDYTLALYLTVKGKVYYMDEVMSSYRTGVENSMMTKLRKNYSKERELEYHKNRIETLCMADEYYDYKYHRELENVLLLSKIKVYIIENIYSVTVWLEYKKFIKQNGLVKFIKIFLYTKNTIFFSKVKNINDKIKNSIKKIIKV